MKALVNNLRIALLVALAAMLLASCGGGGGGSTPSITPNENPSQPAGLNLRAEVIKGVDGVPSGVKVTWTRVTDSTATGYYLYRDDQSLPSGNPAGLSDHRVNGGNKIDQPSSGTTVSFNDEFDPTISTSWYYRLTVVNDTSDESNFSNEISVTIVQFTFDSFSPTEGTVNDTVTISGTNLGVHVDLEDHVYFTGQSGWLEATITAWTQTSADVQVPVGAITGPIRVQIGDLTSDSTGNYTVLPPVLDGVSPSSDYAEHSDITLTGSRFEDSRGTSVVKFGGVPVDTYVSWADTQVVVKVPSDAVDGPVTLTVGAYTTAEQPFTVLPHITGLNPAGAHVGDSFTVEGTGLGTEQGASTVTLGGLELPVTNWNNRAIVITSVPETVSGDVVVTRGGNATDPVRFEVIPYVASFTPTRSWDGQTVTINGTGFGEYQPSSKVYFHDMAEVLTYVVWNPNQIIVEIPSDSQTGPISVEVDGVLGTSADSILIVLGPPALGGLIQY